MHTQKNMSLNANTRTKHDNFCTYIYFTTYVCISSNAILNISKLYFSNIIITVFANIEICKHV